MLSPQYLAYVLQHMYESVVFLRLCNKWVGQAAINAKTLAAQEIPLPPLTVQEEIVAEIESYQRIIDGARQIVGNYKPTIKIDPAWENVKLGEIIRLASGKFLPTSVRIDTVVNGIKEEISNIEQNKRLIEIFQQKIKDKIAEVWGE